MVDRRLQSTLRDRLSGCLLGGLIGDAIGARGEGKSYQEISDTYGTLDEFQGAGTDDTAIRLILLDAIQSSSGHPRVDDFAAAFLRENGRTDLLVRHNVQDQQEPGW